MRDGVGQDPLNFLTVARRCALCENKAGPFASDSFDPAVRTAQMSRRRRLVRTRMLKHLISVHRELAERLYPNWVAAHSDKTAPMGARVPSL